MIGTEVSTRQQISGSATFCAYCRGAEKTSCFLIKPNLKTVFSFLGHYYEDQLLEGQIMLHDRKVTWRTSPRMKPATLRIGLNIVIC